MGVFDFFYKFARIKYKSILLISILILSLIPQHFDLN